MKQHNPLRPPFRRQAAPLDPVLQREIAFWCQILKYMPHLSAECYNGLVQTFIEILRGEFRP